MAGPVGRKRKQSYNTSTLSSETGRRVVRDEDGVDKEDAQKIIYPGSQGDKWWDMEQLIDQVESAIAIVDKAHPDSVALFVFDCSSAHAALAPHALRAFDMNKSNRGKQRRQHDTVIPMSKPDTTYRGKDRRDRATEGPQASP